VDDELHDVTPASRPALPPADAAVATALRAALDAGARRPVDPARLLAGVQARATRRHRRRVVGTSLASAAAVAAVITAGVSLPGPSSPPAHRSPAARATEPSGPSASEPAPSTPTGSATSAPSAPAPVTAASMLTLGDVASVIPHVRAVEAPGARVRAPGDPVTGGLCTDEVLTGVPEPVADLTALWAEPGRSGLPVSVREDLLSWDASTGARQYTAASAAQAAACTAAAAATSAAPHTSETAPYRLLTPPSALGTGSVLALAQVAPTLWRVRVVADRDAVAVSMSANVRAAGEQAAVDAAGGVARLAVAALDRAEAS
jgi:trimeric autotransporter adhesin